ncbi:hypothetical protein DD238_005464 [Peronospora effusa]|uniref:Uncharacterized protein n=1 Tax=Peronospora effusa TaxID=542832 RepID=A0A3M6VQP7_9STRA|nr:hypothetical protein DD238_005464 [Peronospora effusa]RQM14504.1 hypothetical protein DD237_006368 [Peronospora effusa]
MQLVLLLVSSHQTRQVDTQPINWFARVETFRVSFPLNKNLELMLHMAVGQKPLIRKRVFPPASTNTGGARYERRLRLTIRGCLSCCRSVTGEDRCAEERGG